MVQLTELIAAAVRGLGYELVEFERSGGGTLQVFIDHLSTGIAVQDTPKISLADCEKVSSQLHYLLEVEGIDYQRLEVSSPGLDRPLKKWADFARFAGYEAVITLRKPFEGRKKYRGTLRSPQGETMGLELAGKEGPTTLDFTLADIDCARLVPHVNFRSVKR